MTDAMTKDVDTGPVGAEGQSRALAIIDCDVHEAPATIATLHEYLDNGWRHYIANGGFFGLPWMPYTTWQGPNRMDIRPADGTWSGTTLDDVIRQHLDPYKIGFAILTGTGIFYLSAMPQREFATQLASAYNDWLAAEWLGRDPRIGASIQVAAQDPVAAAKEIDRMGDHPDFVQVLLPMTSPGVAWGDEKYHPIWAAAVRHDLPVAFHVCPSGGTMPPPATYGWPRSYMELRCGMSLTYQAELISLVCSGVFEDFPDLRIALLEAGMAWVPSLMWRMDQSWRALRAELPWLRRKPSEYIRDHVRITTQPLDEPDDERHLLQMLEMIGSDEMLIFASDYPHWDFDSPDRAIPSCFGESLRRKIFYENAARFYRFDSERLARLGVDL